MINMHSFSTQDKTLVTFQYENVALHVSISRRSLINTPVLRSHYSKAIHFFFVCSFSLFFMLDGQVLFIKKK